MHRGIAADNLNQFPCTPIQLRRDSLIILEQYLFKCAVLGQLVDLSNRIQFKSGVAFKLRLLHLHQGLSSHLEHSVDLSHVVNECRTYDSNVGLISSFEHTAVDCFAILEV